MIEIKEILEELGNPLSHKQKLIKRYQRLGIEVTGEAVTEEVKNRIIQDVKEHVCLNDYMKEKLVGTDIVPARAVSDIRRHLCAEGKTILDFHNTTFSTRPNTCYFKLKDVDFVDEVISKYIEIVSNGFDFPIMKPVKKKIRIIDKEKEEKKARIKKQKEELIGIIDYLALHEGWEVYTRKIDHRERALFYLEDHDYFGIERIPAEDILFENPKKNPYYVRKESILFLDEQMDVFFSEYGLTEQEKLDQIVENTDNEETLELYLEYLVTQKINSIQPSIVEGARILSKLPDELEQLSNDEVMELLDRTSTKSCRSFIIGFANWIRGRRDVEYGHFIPVERECEKVKAYTFDEYFAFCQRVFHEPCIQEEQMIKKAIEDIRNAGMWMSHSIYATADLRGSDIEKAVSFLRLEKDDFYHPELPRDAEKLAYMIIRDEIPEDTYQDIGDWFISDCMLRKLPVNKTNRGEVLLRATSELKIHFGRLILIGETHYMRGAKKFLDIRKYGSFYNGRHKMKGFYGERMGEWLGRTNFSRLRMNHTVSQLEEQSARTMGMEGLTAMSIAGHSRGHTSVGSMLHYVGDHNLTGEDAAVVLWTMMERKIFGAIPYLAMLTLYPDSFGKLTKDEQTKLLNLSGLTALDIEEALSRRLQQKEYEDVFLRGDIEQAEAVFKTYLAIGQGYGEAMDEGCYCTMRARGYACPRGIRGSCIVTDCPCNTLTADAIPGMIRLIKVKQEQASNGDTKAMAVLEQRLKPKFKSIRKILKNILPEKEMAQITTYMGSLLNDG